MWKRCKSPYIINLAICLNRKSTTDSAEDPFFYQFSIALNSGVVDYAQHFTFGSRISGIARTLNFAIMHVLFPSNLAYEYDLKWPSSFHVGPEWTLPLLVIFVAAYLLYSKRYRYFYFMMLAVVPFLPYSNIIPLKHGVPGQTVYYDHYLLFSCVLASPLLRKTLESFYFYRRHYLIFVLSAVLFFFVAYDNHLAGFWKTKETLYRRNIDISPRLARSYLFLGKAYIASGKYDDAITWLLKGLATQQGAADPDLYQTLGNAYAFSGRYAEAEKYYKIYLTSNGDDTLTLQNLSSTLIMLGKMEEAREVIHRWLLLSPNNAEALANLSLLDKRK